MEGAAREVTSSRWQRAAWCLYDFANSAFPTIIITAVYVLYFKKVVMGAPADGSDDARWGAANAIGAGIVFLTAPILGSIADRAGRKRAFLAAFTALCVIATALLAATREGTVAAAMALVVAAIVGFEGACVFYNAFLPELVAPARMGRLSGAGWALGYVGGLGALLLCLPIAEGHLRLVPLVVAGWYLVFSVPTLVALRDRPRGSPPAAEAKARAGGIRAALARVREHPGLVRFLVAYFFYNNAVLTIIVFAVAFSADSLGFETKESIALVVVMNVVAAPGALAFGWLADRIGAKRTLVVTLAGWLAVVAGAELAAWPDLFAPAAAKGVFWGVAGLASLCIGAVQATSRSFVGQLAPPGRAGQFYGFMAFAGKGSAILGPLVFGLVSGWLDQRAAVASIGVFFAVGLAVLLGVPGARPGADRGRAG